MTIPATDQSIAVDAATLDTTPSSGDKSNEISQMLGYAGLPMRPSPEVTSGAAHWRKVFLRGVQMRRNVVRSNYEGKNICASVHTTCKLPGRYPRFLFKYNPP